MTVQSTVIKLLHINEGEYIVWIVARLVFCLLNLKPINGCIWSVFYRVGNIHICIVESLFLYINKYSVFIYKSLQI